MLPALSPPLPAYAELHCLSNFTFLRGASHPEELVERAHALGYRALALTDECSVCGVVRGFVHAQEVGMQLIVGSSFRLSAASQNGELSTPPHLVALCTTREGYGNLSELISLGRRRSAKGEYCLSIEDFDGRNPEAAHLAGLPDCVLLLVPEHRAPFDRTLDQARWLAKTFPERGFIAVELLRRIDDAEHLATLRKVSRETGVRLVAAGNVHMHVRSRKPLQDTLTAIRLGKPVNECGYALMPNAEAHLRPLTRLASIYPHDLLDATLNIAARCTFSLKELRYEYPREIVPIGHTPTSWLRQRTIDGLRRRVGRAPLPAGLLRTLRRELKLIAELRYEAFFLTIDDVVTFARSQGILCQGRGSAANSAVCWCLGITEVDPRNANLLFERFVSRERDEPPDIDVDFEHQRREVVIQYIYQKYGRDRAAIAATLICYRPRSALRDVGKALGIDGQRVDQLSKSHQWWDRGGMNLERIQEAGFDLASPIVRLWVELTNTLVGFPRHLSQHVGGFVIARDKLTRLVPVENAAMADRSVIQWDKDDLESLGLLKVDVLALGMLSAIRRALEFISDKLGRPFAMQDIPRDDEPTYDMICEADTVGVFQIESRAQMTMLPRLQPRTLYDLTVQVAIVRPGPIVGGMVHPYLRRRAGVEADDTVEALRPALGRTLGVPVFQEQVMQVAMIAAGFTAGEADQLRRAMAAWKRKGGLQKFHERLVEGMIARGYSKEFSERIFKQAEGFGEYGFPESHAAGFGQLAYFSSWIKCHHPDAFLAALLNSQPMGFYAPSQLVQDAARHGVEVRPVDVMHSDWESTLEPASSGKYCAVRLGLQRLDGMRQDAALRIVSERRHHAFKSVEELAQRCALDRAQVQSLAAGNALASLAGHRRQARWEVAGLKAAPPVFKHVLRDEAPLALNAASEHREIADDYASMGLTLRRHPVALLRAELSKMRIVTARELATYPNGRIARACGIVTGRQRPGTAGGVIFVTLEDETGFVNVIVWKSLVERQRRKVLGSSLLTVYGVWQRDPMSSRVMHLIAKRLVDHSDLLKGLATSSRDFH